MGELSRERYLTRHDLEVVIRRAAELEAKAGSAVPELSEADLVRIASEVGLSEDSVRRALAEHYADTSVERLLVERGFASRLCGPSLVSASRRIPGVASDIQQTLENHFRSNESLRLIRRTGTGSLWEPESGVVASVMRSFDLSGRGYKLAKKARALELQVVDSGEGWAKVTLTADLANERAGWFWGLGVATGGGAAVGAAALIVGLPSIPAAFAAGAPALMGISTMLARTGYHAAVSKMRLVLEGTLDRLEHGEPLEPPRPSLRDLWNRVRE
jgi:hypothetical protein